MWEQGTDQANCWRSFSNSLAMSGTELSSPDPLSSADLDKEKKTHPWSTSKKGEVRFKRAENELFPKEHPHQVMWNLIRILKEIKWCYWLLHCGEIDERRNVHFGHFLFSLEHPTGDTHHQLHRTLSCNMRDVTFKDYNSFLFLISPLPFVLALELSKLTHSKCTANFDRLGQCDLLRSTKHELSLHETLPSRKHFIRQFI